MKIEEMKQELVKVLEQYNWPTKNVDRFVTKWQKAKQPINERFGLNEDNDFRIIIPIEYSKEMMNQEFPSLREIYYKIDNMKQFRHTRFTFDWLKNEVTIRNLEESKPEHSMRITRFLSAPEIAEYLTPFVNEWIDDFNISQVKNDGVVKSKDTLYKAIITAIGEISSVMTKNKTVMVLSTNFVDMMTSSSNSSYTSCYNLEGGCHNAGTTQYCIDSHSMIAYIARQKDLSYKLGRSMVFVDKENFNKFFIGRHYGCLNSSDETSLSIKIKEILGLGDMEYFDMDFEDNDWLKPKRIGGAGKGGPGYFDYNMGYYKTVEDESDLIMSFPHVFCFECGKVKTFHKGGICKTCSNEKKQTYVSVVEPMVINVDSTLDRLDNAAWTVIAREYANDTEHHVNQENLFRPTVLSEWTIDNPIIGRVQQEELTPPPTIEQPSIQSESNDRMNEDLENDARSMRRIILSDRVREVSRNNLLYANTLKQ